MSRLGKIPLPIPSSVQVTVKGGRVRVKGPKGDLTHPIEKGVGVRIEKERLWVTRENDERLTRASQGLLRSHVRNMIGGVTQEYQKTLEISGVGFRAQIQGRNLTMNLGFSHPTIYSLPAGIEATVEKQTVIKLKGADKYWVGQAAAQIRALRPPEPYKGKGIKYAGEVIERKEGKTSK